MKVLVKVALSLCAGLLIPVPGYAIDSKIYSGIECQPTDEKQLVHYGGGGGAFNNTREQIFVVCPITRDNTSNTNGTSQVSVRVRDESQESSVQCALSSDSP